MFDKIIERGIKRGGILAQSERLICHRLTAGCNVLSTLFGRRLVMIGFKSENPDGHIQKGSEQSLIVMDKSRCIILQHVDIVKVFDSVLK